MFALEESITVEGPLTYPYLRGIQTSTWLVGNDVHRWSLGPAWSKVHPADMLADDAYPNEPCLTLNEASLERLKESTKKFYLSVGQTLSDTLSEEFLRKRLVENQIHSDDLAKQYLRGPARRKN